MVSAAETDIFSSIFGRTDLKIGASKAKNCEEVDFEVQIPVDLPKPAQKGEKGCSAPKNFVEKIFCGRKLNCRGSSETRFGKFLGRSEPCLRGKRPFEVRRDIRYKWIQVLRNAITRQKQR